MSVLRAGVVSAFVHGSGLAVRLGFMLGLVRWTSSDIVGIYALAASIEAVVVYLSGMEFHTFTARRYAKAGKLAKLRVLVSSHVRLLRVTVPLAAIMGVVASISFSLTSDWVALGLMGALLSTSAIAQELGRYLVLTNRPVQSVVQSTLRTAAWQPIALLFVDVNLIHSLRVMLCLWVAFSMISVAWAAYLLRGVWWPLAPNRARHTMHGLSEARSYYGIASLTVVQSNLERFVLQLLLGPAQVGIYSFFQMLSNTLAALVQTASLNIALPEILTKFGQRHLQRFEYLAHLRKRVLKISVVTGIVVFGFAFPLTSVLSKPEYMAQFWLLPLLIAAQVLMMWTQPIHLALYAARHDRFLVRLMGLALIVGFVLDFAFIKWLGLAGAVIAPLVVCAVVSITRIRFMSQLRLKEQL